ncbi:uncharacterized protein LOC107872916 isoform X2 [Capsicum annuum]|uniref:uncharacterized protein LOC107872916 isoform X2 n=1 Tax=Capsicum annuum TaxID=4072 RepID=UPI001FB07FCE|nr:uncharacterized protein LOC107872916 isoform X2 [Capsicum annuum]
MVDTTLSCAPLLQMLMSYASATYLLKNIRYFLSSADSHYKKDREVKVQHYVNSIKCMPQPAGVRLISVPRSAHFAVGTGHRVCSIRQRRSCCLFITRVILRFTINVMCSTEACSPYQSKSWKLEAATKFKSCSLSRFHRRPRMHNFLLSM